MTHLRSIGSIMSRYSCRSSSWTQSAGSQGAAQLGRMWGTPPRIWSPRISVYGKRAGSVAPSPSSRSSVRSTTASRTGRVGVLRHDPQAVLQSQLDPPWTHRIPQRRLQVVGDHLVPPQRLHLVCGCGGTWGGGGYIYTKHLAVSNIFEA